MDTRTRILQTIDEMHDDIVTLVATLVRIPSVNPRYTGMDYNVELGGESACNRKLAESYRAIGCEIDLVEKEEGRPNLVGTYKGRGGGRSLIYNGPIDVVPVGDPGDWRFQDPFSGKIQDGKLF